MNLSKKKRNLFLTLTLIMVLLMIITSIRGMADPDFYAEETQNWRIQCVAQDLFNLSILAPSLLISGILVYRNRSKAGFFWAGSLVCTAYTFVIYAFSVHFNPMFLFYCWILGLSFYTLILFLNETGFKNLSFPILHRRSAGIASGFIILASILFLLLWLKDIVPGIVNDITPPVLIETGLIINPVHALDLSIILPAMFLAGWFQFRNIEAGKILLPVMLGFMTLMSLTISFIIYYSWYIGLEEGGTTGHVFTLLALLSFGLYLSLFRHQPGVDSIEKSA